MSLGDQPAPYFGEEQAPHLSASYCYALLHEDGTRQFWTSYDRALTLENLPAEIEPTGTAVFIPSQIKHGSIEKNDRFDAQGVTVSVDSKDERLRRFFVMAAAVKLKMWILRINMASMETTVDASTQSLVVEAGILSKFGFNGNAIAAQLIPDPLFVSHSVPRFFCQRQCNHVLYGVGCELDKDDFSIDTEIVSVDARAREIVVEGRAAEERYFEGGMFDHWATGLKFTIVWSEWTGTDQTKFKLAIWHPELEAGQSLKAYAGCTRTVEICTNRFNNAANFGGFPFVPSKNPVTNGVG